MQCIISEEILPARIASPSAASEVAASTIVQPTQAPKVLPAVAPVIASASEPDMVTIAALGKVLEKENAPASRVMRPDYSAKGWAARNVIPPRAGKDNMHEYLSDEWWRHETSKAEKKVDGIFYTIQARQMEEWTRPGGARRNTPGGYPMERTPKHYPHVDMMRAR